MTPTDQRDALIEFIKRIDKAPTHGHAENALTEAMNFIAAIESTPKPVAMPNDAEVICPECCHQFRAIPVEVQRLMLSAGFEPPFTASPKPLAEQRWISIKAKLPPDNIGVLVTDGTVVTAASYSHRYDLWSGHEWDGYEWEFYFDITAITHWMTLPPPPSSTQEETPNTKSEGGG